jgi:hypothetical protein
LKYKEITFVARIKPTSNRYGMIFSKDKILDNSEPFRLALNDLFVTVTGFGINCPSSTGIFLLYKMKRDSFFLRRIWQHRADTAISCSPAKHVHVCSSGATWPNCLSFYRWSKSSRIPHWGGKDINQQKFNFIFFWFLFTCAGLLLPI